MFHLIEINQLISLLINKTLDAAGAFWHGEVAYNYNRKSCENAYFIFKIQSRMVAGIRKDPNGRCKP